MRTPLRVKFENRIQHQNNDEWNVIPIANWAIGSLGTYPERGQVASPTTYGVNFVLCGKDHII
jgi:hypothetical protein